MKIVLKRFESGAQGTFGQIFAPGLTLYTGELPWRENQPNISCIPEGEYECLWTWSPRFRRFMYLVDSVPHRSGIRKHPANLMGAADRGYKSQLNGCIALGEKLGWIEDQKALLLSAPAVRRFEEHMRYAPFKLEVKSGSTLRRVS